MTVMVTIECCVVLEVLSTVRTENDKCDYNLSSFSYHDTCCTKTASSRRSKKFQRTPGASENSTPQSNHFHTLWCRTAP